MALGVEDIIHKKFAAVVRQYEVYNQLKCSFWTYTPFGEFRKKTTAFLLAAKGTKAGVADYLFIKRKLSGIKPDGSDLFDLHYIWIEFKKPKTETAAGKQNDSQKAFEAIFKDSLNSRYYIAYSVEEGIKILQKEGIL